MHFKIFADVNTSDKARKVLHKVLTLLESDYSDEEVKSYHKGGFICSFTIALQTDNWPQSVFQALLMAQKIGRSWVLTGNIAEELDAWSSEPSVVGVQNIHVVLSNA